MPEPEYRATLVKTDDLAALDSFAEDFAAEGMPAIEALLAKHAGFDAYLREHGRA